MTCHTTFWFRINNPHLKNYIVKLKRLSGKTEKVFSCKTIIFKKNLNPPLHILHCLIIIYIQFKESLRFKHIQIDISVYFTSGNPDI